MTFRRTRRLVALAGALTMAMATVGSVPGASAAGSHDGVPHRSLGQVGTAYVPRASNGCVAEGDIDAAVPSARVERAPGTYTIAGGGGFTAYDPATPDDLIEATSQSAASERHNGDHAHPRSRVRGTTEASTTQPSSRSGRCTAYVISRFSASTTFRARRPGRIVVTAEIDGARLALDAEGSRFDTYLGYIEPPPDTVRLEVPVSGRGGKIFLTVLGDCSVSSGNGGPPEHCSTSVDARISFEPRP